MMNHYTLLHGDCLHWLPQLKENSIDLVVTSPPYNVGIDYGYYTDDQPYEEYLDWLDQVWNECYRVLKPGGRIGINVGDVLRTPYIPIHCDITVRLRKRWLLRGIIIWYKRNCLSNTAWGSWQSASNPVLRGVQEFIIVASKQSMGFKKDKEDDQWKKDEFVSYTLEHWDFTPETRKNDHPAPFPKELPKRLIKLYTYPGDVILDPFMGSGTTMEVCQDLRRSCMGIELNEEYCKQVKRRCWGRQFLDRPVEYHSSLSSTNK